MRHKAQGKIKKAQGESKKDEKTGEISQDSEFGRSDIPV